MLLGLGVGHLQCKETDQKLWTEAEVENARPSARRSPCRLHRSVSGLEEEKLLACEKVAAQRRLAGNTRTTGCADGFNRMKGKVSEK